VHIDTGDPMPEGFDAVIMIEDVHFLDDKTFEITAAVSPWENVRPIGEDVVATEMILPANHLIRPVDIGAILAGGLIEIKVHPKPKVALIPTGNELVQPGSELKKGSIIEYNSRVLGAYITQWGGRPERREIAPDNFDELDEALTEALDKADIVIINAGSSAGREDYTSSLIKRRGTLLTHGIATKPGKPVVLGCVSGKPVIGIPGYPVSAILAMQLFVQPIISRRLGMPMPHTAITDAIASRKIVSSLGSEEFIRVKLGKVGEKFIATPMTRGAGIITSLVRADGIVRIPRLSEGVHAGEEIKVELLRPVKDIENTTVAIGSHDMILDLIANYIAEFYPGSGLSSAHVGSMGGLAALRRGEAHMAGTHLLDDDTGDYNVSYIERILPGEQVVLINLVYRQQGYMVAPGNPLGITSVQDLARPDVKFINRQRGAGTRVLLDYKLKEEGIDPTEIVGYEREEFTHTAVAAAVASGSADVGLGIMAAAKALKLDFVPLLEERYDLCIPRKFWDTPFIDRVRRVIKTSQFREEVEGLGGYSLRDCGEVMWEKR
ncbi:MAG TPA: molybdopterin biosynthesis protein, partial [Clostridia bacterium]|nr:molybdopterin biosynthesis protein [Clostridia bacterium]